MPLWILAETLKFFLRIRIIFNQLDKPSGFLQAIFKIKKPAHKTGFTFIRMNDFLNSDGNGNNEDDDIFHNNIR